MADEWRLLYNNEADVADILAIPSAVAEGKIAGRYIMAAKATPETIIIQNVKKKGILAGAEVSLDLEEAKKLDIDVVVQSKAGRASSRPAGTISLQEMMLKSSGEFNAVDRGEDDLAALIYTSGTTGLPKGVMLTQGNFIAECETTDDAIRTRPVDRFASLVPFFHVFGLADACVLALFRGCASVLIPQYHPRKFLKILSDANVSVVLAIPSQYLHLMLAARRKKEEERPKVKYCVSGAAPLPLKVIDAFKEIFGASIIEGYGMTESTSAVAVNPPENIKPGSIGIPCPGVEMKVVDDADNELEEGKAGEIVIKGNMVSPGYYNLPDETKETFINDWLHSGDIGYKDEDGYFFITDRKKDIIIKGGFNISPKEIEDLLSQHPKVKEAAVIGEEKEEKKEDIKAFCVLSEGESASREEILDFCRKTLASYKTPDDIEFIEILPKSATGKLLRKELRGDYKDMRLIERDE
jgi:long-chain acyl-CoA synthetase